MKNVLTILALMLITLSCSTLQGPTPSSTVSNHSTGVIDLSWYSEPVSLLIQVEDVHLHPGTGAGLISQVTAKVLDVLEGRLPSCDHVTFTIATRDTKEYTPGNRYILKKGVDAKIIDRLSVVKEEDRGPSAQ